MNTLAFAHRLAQCECAPGSRSRRSTRSGPPGRSRCRHRDVSRRVARHVELVTVTRPDAVPLLAMDRRDLVRGPQFRGDTIPRLWSADRCRRHTRVRQKPARERRWQIVAWKSPPTWGPRPRAKTMPRKLTGKTTEHSLNDVRGARPPPRLPDHAVRMQYLKFSGVRSKAAHSELSCSHPTPPGLDWIDGWQSPCPVSNGAGWSGPSSLLNHGIRVGRFDLPSGKRKRVGKIGD